MQNERVELPAFDGEPMTTRFPLYIEMKVFDRTCYMTEDDFRIVSGLSGHRTSSNRKSFAELSEVREYLAKIGRKGGQAGAGKESPTSRKNGANGGRPRKYPKSSRTVLTDSMLLIGGHHI